MSNSNLSLKNKQDRLPHFENTAARRHKFSRRRTALTLALAALLPLLGCGLSSNSPPSNRTPLPTLTPTPQFEHFRAGRIIQAFQAAGLEAAAVQPVPVANFGAPQAPDAEALAFTLPSLCPDCGGVVLSFTRPEDLTAARSYLVNIQSERQPAWIFARENVLLQLDGRLTETQARQYGDILAALP